MLAWLAAASAPTDTTSRGQSFGCSTEPQALELSSTSAKTLYEQDFRMPMGVRYWALSGVRFATPGDSATAQPLSGRIIFEGPRDGDESFGLRADYSLTDAQGRPEQQRFWVFTPSPGAQQQFEGVPIEVVAKAASADTLGLLLRGTSGALEHEYRIHISGRLGRGSLECRQRPPGGAWATRLRLDFTR